MHMGRMWGISLLRRSWAISLLQRRWGISLLWRTWGISLGEREASAFFGQREAPHFSGEREASPFFGNVRNLPSLGTWGISLLGERGHLPSSENVRNLTPFAGLTCPRAAGRTPWERESRLSALAVQGRVGDKWPHETWPLAARPGTRCVLCAPQDRARPPPRGPALWPTCARAAKGSGAALQFRRLYPSGQESAQGRRWGQVSGPGSHPTPSRCAMDTWVPTWGRDAADRPPGGVPALACLCEGGRLSCPRWLASLPHRFLKSCGIFIRLFTNHLIGRYHPCPVETGRKGSAVSEWLSHKKGRKLCHLYRPGWT